MNNINIIASAVAGRIASITGVACSPLNIKEYNPADGSAFYGVQPIGVQREKIDRTGTQENFCLEVVYFAPESAGPVDDVFKDVEEDFLNDRYLKFDNIDLAYFQKAVYASETNIFNGGVLEGFYNADELETSGVVCSACMLYFSSWV